MTNATNITGYVLSNGEPFAYIRTNEKIRKIRFADTVWTDIHGNTGTLNVRDYKVSYAKKWGREYQERYNVMFKSLVHIEDDLYVWDADDDQR